MSQSLRFAKAVEALALPFGFRYSRKRNALVRSESHGFSELLWTCHPTLLSGVAGQQRSLVAGVRHDVVEDVVNQLGLVYGADNQRATATVDRALAYFPLRGGQSYSFFLPDHASEPELQAAAALVSAWLKDDLDPFFCQYASLAECAQGLSSDPMAEVHALCNNYQPRMYRAIASSCLSGTSGAAEQLKIWRAAYPRVLPQSSHAKVEQRLAALEGLLGGP